MAVESAWERPSAAGRGTPEVELDACPAAKHHTCAHMGDVEVISSASNPTALERRAAISADGAVSSVVQVQRLRK